MTTTHTQPEIESSYSALNTHRRCPQQWFYKYDLRLEKSQEDVSPERDFGSWWSVIRAAEAIERGRKFESLKQDPNTQIKLPDGSKVTLGVLSLDGVFEALNLWWKGEKTTHVGEVGTALDVWQERLGGEAPELAASLLQRHLDRWADEVKYEHPLGVEVYWQKQLPQPKNDPWQVEYPQMLLRGYVDEIFWHNERRIYIVRDHKTSKQLDAASSVDDMMDSQLHLYAWGVNDTVREWTGGKSVQAVAYDRARSVAPRPPTLTKSGRLSVYKGEPSLSSTDLQTYLDWVAGKPEFPGLKKDGSGAGVYELEDKVVEKLKTQGERERWFQRTLRPLNRNLIQTHLRAAVDSSTDAYRTQHRAMETREAQRNLSKMCSWCDYVNLCRAQMVGGAKGSYNLDEYGLTSKDGFKMLDRGHIVTEEEKVTNEFDL